jgi:O-antigen ligase
LDTWGRYLVIGVSGGLLIFAPLAFGAVHPWAYFPIALILSIVSLGTLTFGLYLTWTGPGKERFLPYPPIWWCAAGLGALILVQLTPWAQGLVRWLSPSAWEIRALGNGFGLADHIPLSLNPNGTILETLKLWPAMVLFFILIYTVSTRRQIRGLVVLILAVALFEVFYGFWHFQSHLIWGWKNHYTGTRLCGTFINSNHLAFFLNMAILLGFGLFLAQRKITPNRPEASSAWNHVRRLSRAENLEPKLKGFFLLFLLLLLVVGLIFTGSRGGMISLAAGFGLMALLIWGQRWAKGHIYLMLGFLLAAMLYSLLLGSSQLLVSRFRDLTDKERYYAMKGAWSIFKAYPLVGSGLGTFGEVFYQFEPAELQGKYFIYTHNDWLQLLAETGILGFLIMLVAWLLFFSGLIRQWRQRHDVFARYLTLGGIAAMGAAVFQSLAEFPFHIPALFLAFACLAAITYLTGYSRLQRDWHHFSYPTLKFPGHRYASTLILLGLMGVQVVFLGQIWHQFRAEGAAPTAPNSTCLPPKLKVKDFQRALSFNPRNSQYFLGLTEALEKDPKENGGPLPEEENYLKSAIMQAPSYWGYRLKLAEFYLKRQEHDPARYIPAGLMEMLAAVKLFPESGALHFSLASALAWAERYYSGLIPLELRDRCNYHFVEAIKMDPRLRQFLK